MKFSVLFVAVCGFVAAPAAMADITLSSAYFVADAQVESNLYGSGLDHDEGFAPVDVYVAVGGQEGGAAAMAASDWLNLIAWSAVDSAPGHIGAAVSSAGSVLMELTSDTSWRMDIITILDIDFSVNGSAGVASEVAVTDLANNPIYSYDVTVDGLADSVVIGPGSYNVAFYITTFGIIPEVSNIQEFANSSVGLSASVVPIPEPSTALLGFIGVGMVGWLRKRGILCG